MQIDVIYGKLFCHSQKIKKRENEHSSKPQRGAHASSLALVFSPATTVFTLQLFALERRR